LLRAGLVTLALSVHADNDQPEHEGAFSEKAEGDVPGIQMMSESWRQRSQPGETAKRHHHAEDSRKEGRAEDQVAGDEAVESVKDEGDVDVFEMPFDRFKGEAHEVEGGGEESEAATYRLEYAVKEQGDGNEEEHGDEPRCVEHPAANEGFGEYRCEHA